MSSLLLSCLKYHITFYSLIGIHLQRSQLSTVYVVDYLYGVVTHHCALTHFPCVLHNKIDSKAFVVFIPVSWLLLRSFEDDFLLFFVVEGILLGHARTIEFRQAHVLVLVGEVGDSPLLLILVPVGVVHYVVNVFLRHHHIQNGCQLLDFLLLVADSVQELLLLVLVLVLDVPEFLHVGHILILNFPEPHLHLVHFLIQVLIVLLNAQQFFLPPLLLQIVLLLFFLLQLQLLLQLLYLLQLALVSCVWNVVREVLLQIEQLLLECSLLLLLVSQFVFFEF